MKACIIPTMGTCHYVLILVWFLTEFKTVWNLDTVTMSDVDGELPEERLSCWNCKHTDSKPNPNCVTMTNKTMITRTECRKHETFCQIKKRTSNSHVEWFERSCAQTCDSICQQFKTLKQCNWCCMRSDCNAGSSGNRLVTNLYKLIPFISLCLMHLGGLFMKCL